MNSFACFLVEGNPVSMSSYIPSSSYNFFSRTREEEKLLEENWKKEWKEKEINKKEAKIGNQGGPTENDREGTTNLFNMAMMGREDSKLKLLVFHGNGKEDHEQHMFLCE